MSTFGGEVHTSNGGTLTRPVLKFNSEGKLVVSCRTSIPDLNTCTKCKTWSNWAHAGKGTSCFSGISSSTQCTGIFANGFTGVITTCAYSRSCLVKADANGNENCLGDARPQNEIVQMPSPEFQRFTPAKGGQVFHFNGVNHALMQACPSSEVFGYINE